MITPAPAFTLLNGLNGTHSPTTGLPNTYCQAIFSTLLPSRRCVSMTNCCVDSDGDARVPLRRAREVVYTTFGVDAVNGRVAAGLPLPQASPAGTLSDHPRIRGGFLNAFPDHSRPRWLILA